MRAALALAIAIGSGVSAFADSGPVIAIPSRPGVPIVINGRDAAYAVVEGDWGLAKGQRVPVTVYDGYGQFYTPPAAHYYPRTGRTPGYGRVEVDTPPRHLPRAETFERSWSAESRPDARAAQPPLDPPPVLYAPRERWDGAHDPDIK